MFFTQNLVNQASEIIKKAKEKNIKITFAESCTGGLLSALFTEVSGSSEVIERGFVTYSNEAKNELLGVKKSTLEKFGAVSDECAREMAVGALKNSHASLSLAITGIAGPNGGSKDKPVGLVYIALNFQDRVICRKFNFAGDRTEIRKASVIASLAMIQSLINS